MSQKMEVYNFMKEKGSITTMQAFYLGITRLAARIHELRKDGIAIGSETIVRVNRHGKEIRLSRYWLVKPE